MEIVRTAPIPAPVIAACAGTDGGADYPQMWAVAHHLHPHTILELGTRGGLSARILHNAVPHAAITTVDIEDCSLNVSHPIMFIRKDAAELFLDWHTPVDLLFIDTDPHSKFQTLGWLNTWMEWTKVALFHDSRTSGVGAAIDDWLELNPEWRTRELGMGNGMRIVWKP